MLHIHLNDLLDADEATICRQIEAANWKLRVTMIVSAQYQADSRRALADGWLQSWYLAESMAAFASKWRAHFKEVGRGDGEFDFEFDVSNPKGMAAKLVDFGLIFDPNQLEPAALMLDEAVSWLDGRGSAAARFPELEECYRDELVLAPETVGDEGEHADVTDNH